MDIIIWIAVMLCGISAIFTTVHWKLKVISDGRDFEDCIADIRAMNTYNSYFLAGILIFFGLIIEKGITFVPKSSLYLLIFAFISASLAIIFIPLKKPFYGAGKAKYLWLHTLIFTQFTVVLTAVGVLNAIIIIFELL